jgi:peptide/nickel transport system permease protein
MKRFLLNRLLVSLLTIFTLATILFLVFRLGPTDPTLAVMGDVSSPEMRAVLTERFGLDKSLWEQYVIYMWNLAQGDMGTSFVYGQPVSQLIGGRLLNTVVLMLPSLVLAYGFGAVAGAYIAWRRGGTLEVTTVTTSIIFRSGPIFWVAIMFIYIFSIQLGWFPQSHMRTPGYSGGDGLWVYFSWDFLHHLILPMVVMALYYSCYPLLIMRTSMLEVMGEDFIDLAKAKGLSENRVLFRHAMRNSLLPIVTSISGIAALAIGGSVLIENVFSWPGLGRMIVAAVQDSDFPLAQGCLLLLGITVIIGNFAVDLLYGVFDPRIRYA